jgi:hypothetical protein
MKKIVITYWVFTAFGGALMLMAAIPDLLQVPGARGVIAHLGYPAYLLPFLGVAKLLGVAALLVPRFPRLKEWAYAGLSFDLVGAFYSHLSVGDGPGNWLFPIIGLVLVIGSYFFYQQKLPHHEISELGGNLSRPA